MQGECSAEWLFCLLRSRKGLNRQAQRSAIVGGARDAAAVCYSWERRGL